MRLDERLLGRVLGALGRAEDDVGGSIGHGFVHAEQRDIGVAVPAARQLDELGLGSFLPHLVVYTVETGPVTQGQLSRRRFVAPRRWRTSCPALVISGGDRAAMGSFGFDVPLFRPPARCPPGETSLGRLRWEPGLGARPARCGPSLGGGYLLLLDYPSGPQFPQLSAFRPELGGHWEHHPLLGTLAS